MDLLPALDHDQLLTLAFKTQAAAHDGDRDRLKADTLKLFAAFTEHLLSERPALLRVSPGDARILLRGQQRIVDLLIELAVYAARNSGECCCDRLADTLLAELTLQADDERRHLVAAAV
jgi:hypothetical protein